MAKRYRKLRHYTQRHPGDDSAGRQQRKLPLIWESLSRDGVTPLLAAARMAHLGVRVTPAQAEIALAFAKWRNDMRRVNSYV